MRDAIPSARQRNATKEEDDEHHIGKDCGDVDDAATLGDALHHAEIDECPGDAESQANGEIKLLRLVDVSR